MRFSKGTIKNLNKRLITSALSLTLIMVPLTGCAGTELKYEQNEQGEIVCVGNIEHGYIKNYKVVIFEFNDEQLIYIAKAFEHHTTRSYTEYFNVFGGQLIYNTLNTDSDLKIIYEEDLVSYLVLYDKVKDEYSEQDLKELLEQIKMDYEEQVNKQLVKE